MLAILVIFVLALLWAAVLVPPILRSRSESGAAGGISDFFGRLRDGLGRHPGGDPSLPPLQPLMGPVTPPGGPGRPAGGPGSMPMGGNGSIHAPVGPVRVPGSMSPAQRRRRDVLVALLAIAGVTFLMALFSSGVAFWLLHLLADLLVAGYVYLLLQLKARTGGERRAAAPLAGPGPPVPTLPNVHDITARRFPPATSAEGARDARGLALRRSASW